MSWAPGEGSGNAESDLWEHREPRHHNHHHHPTPVGMPGIRSSISIEHLLFDRRLAGLAVPDAHEQKNTKKVNTEKCNSNSQDSRFPSRTASLKVFAFAGGAYNAEVEAREIREVEE